MALQAVLLSIFAEDAFLFSGAGLLDVRLHSASVSKISWKGGSAYESKAQSCGPR